MIHDVIIIGLGAMGSATAMHLAERGKNVLGLEQHAIPHALGSSHGDSRVIRLSYYEHPAYVPLLRAAFGMWESIGARHGRTLLHRTGGLYMGAPEGTFISGVRRAICEHDLKHEMLDRAQIVRRYPMFDLAPEMIGVFEPWAGAVMAEPSIALFAEAALRAGAELHGHTTVRGWHADERGVTVETDRGTHHGEQLVLCAGAWSGTLAAHAGLPLTVTRQVLGWIWPSEPDRFAPERFPVWGIDDPDGHFHYGFPMLPGRPGLKVARHWIGPVTDPEKISRSPTDADRAEIESLVERTIPSAAGAILSLAICMYTNTPDGHFIVGRHPTHERVLLAAGFSGHGFKFAPIIGEALADLAVNGVTDHSIGFLSPARFGESL